MSADLHLRTFDPAVLPRELVEEYLALENAPLPAGADAWRRYELAEERRSELYEAIYALDASERRHAFLGDDLWIGQVSWAKTDAATWRRYVPRSVEHFSRTYARHGNILRLTPGTCAHLLTGFNLPHDSQYENQRDARGGTPKRGIYGRLRAPYGLGVVRAADAKRFFAEHAGELSFLESQ